jgi:NAD(P)-dependent dehydrogenase (short-subunit alcohol dehydrogenase family)
VITGASAGVGRATAHAFAAGGARIGRAGRSRHPSASGSRRRGRGARREGARAALDVADPDAVEAAAQRVKDRFGPIDIWVNCAMATIFAPFHRITPEEYRHALHLLIGIGLLFYRLSRAPR